MAEQVMIVKVIGDDSSLLRMAKRDEKAIAALGTTTNKNLKRVDDAFTKTQRIAAGGFVGGAALTAAIAGIRTTTDAASDLQEQVSKSGQVFGESSRDVVAWSKTTSEAIGVSQTAALEATGTFGNLFTAIGVGAPEAAETSKRLVQLAADLASFNNADPTQVLDALRSGLVGEVEPLRRFGVLLTEARVQQVALAQTGKDNVKALTAQEKALARVAIIFDDTNKAQGDFARTSQSLANQQRILAARTADLRANLGQLLLPAVTAVTAEMVEATDAAIKLADALRGLGDVKIPTIRIPIVGDVGGGGIGGAVGGFLGRALDPEKIALRVLPPGLAAETALEIKRLLEGQSANVRPDLAEAFADTFNGLVQDAFDDAAPKARPPKAPKGFGTGLTPQDLYGPLIKSVSDAQKEALLDAKRLTPDNLTDDLAQLLDTRASLLKSLDDPRLKAKGRLEIKQALDSVQSQIDSTNDAITSTIREANDRRTAKLEAAARAALVAKEKHKAALEKIAEARREAEEKAREVLQGRQFRALGLDPTGGDLIPGVENLRKQLDSLSRRVVGEDVPKKLLARLAGVRRVLAGGFGEVTEATRQAIKELFDTIRGEFDNGAKDAAGPLTKTTALNTDRILEGLGLGGDLERELKARLSRFNSAGLSLAGRTTTAIPGGFVSGSVAATPIVVNTTVELDGQAVGQSTKRFLANDRRNNPPQKRGPNSI